MRFEATTNLVFGDMELCPAEMLVDRDVAVLHAAKDPCHRRAVGYTTRAPDRAAPGYYFKRDGLDLYLNIIDPAVPLFSTEVFEVGLAFIAEHVAKRMVHIHCNQGQSRAPSFALLHLARTGQVENGSFERAWGEVVMRRQWPYIPGEGIKLWLMRHWASLV